MLGKIKKVLSLIKPVLKQKGLTPGVDVILDDSIKFYQLKDSTDVHKRQVPAQVMNLQEQESVQHFLRPQ